MSRFFIHRPVFAIVIALMLLILGTLAGFSLPIAQYPQISPPTIDVSTTYVGANASVVNETVAQIIEKEVNGTQGMDYMSSHSSSTGQYSLSVVFTLDTDADMDSVKTQNNVSIATASLPTDVQTYGVTTKKSSPDMVLVGSLSSPDGTYSEEYLKNYADIYFIDQIKRVKGGGVEVKFFDRQKALEKLYELDGELHGRGRAEDFMKALCTSAQGDISHLLDEEGEQ